MSVRPEPRLGTDRFSSDGVSVNKQKTYKNSELCDNK